MADALNSYSDGDVDTNRSNNPTLESLVEARYSRRSALAGGAAIGSALFLPTLLAGCGGDEKPDVNVGSGAAAAKTATGQTSSGAVFPLSATVTNASALSGFSWTQTSGPAVKIENPDSLNANFLAPSVASNTPLAFRFSAKEGNNTLSADVTVNVEPAKLGFTAVQKSLADQIVVPTGYEVTVLYRLGDPIKSSTSAYANNGTDTDFASRIGDHGDALYWFGLSATTNARDDNSSMRGLIVQNHENITQRNLHVNGPTTVNGARPEGEALKEMEAHGVVVVEALRAPAGKWTYHQGSTFNRRITPQTIMDIRGPLRGHPLARTAFSPDGTRARGTLNNCANGFTFWGTAITCEENWAGYFRRRTATDDARRTAKEITAFSRYGVRSPTGNYGWSTVTPAVASNTIWQRWTVEVSGTDAAQDYRNEANHFGYCVEIDPYDPTSTPRKRTALGRMAMEGCWPSNVVAGRKPAFYMGDDSRGEYTYKFVSSAPWDPADANRTDRLAVGDKYLDAGTLYVAKFNADGTGLWLPLVFGQGPLTPANPTYAFADQADVVVHARLAADALGATRMDRPEWTGVNPLNGEIYLTLTNNNATIRSLANVDAANPRHYNDPRTNGTAQRGNPNGHIIRMRERADNTESTSFTWDIYLFGAGADLDAANINISGLDATNDFSSPDGLWFARPTNASGLVNPIVWIQTDDGAYTDVTNPMMLIGMPGRVGDGGAKTITSTDAAGAQRQQSTIVGKAPGAANLKRFLVGPVDAEITGVDSTPDGRALFVGIQHPGEDGPGNSSWPDGGTARPRSATIVITRTDGGVVGLS